MATRKRVDSWVVTDDFWRRVEPLIPVRARVASKAYVRKPGAGRPPKPARQVFEHRGPVTLARLRLVDSEKDAMSARWGGK